MFIVFIVYKMNKVVTKIDYKIKNIFRGKACGKRETSEKKWNPEKEPEDRNLRCHIEDEVLSSAAEAVITPWGSFGSYILVGVCY